MAYILNFYYIFFSLGLPIDISCVQALGKKCTPNFNSGLWTLLHFISAPASAKNGRLNSTRLLSGTN